MSHRGLRHSLAKSTRLCEAHAVVSPLNLLGDPESVSAFLTEAIGRADRLVNGHRETSALAFAAAVI